VSVSTVIVHEVIIPGASMLSSRVPALPGAPRFGFGGHYSVFLIIIVSRPLRISLNVSLRLGGSA